MQNLTDTLRRGIQAITQHTGKPPRQIRVAESTRQKLTQEIIADAGGSASADIDSFLGIPIFTAVNAPFGVAFVTS